MGNNGKARAWHNTLQAQGVAKYVHTPRAGPTHLDSSASEFSPMPDAAGSVTTSATALQKLTVGEADVAVWAAVSV